MEFLNSVALPQPTEHMQLLYFMMNLVFIMLIPYLGFLLGTASLSYYYNRRGRKEGDTVEVRFAELLIELGAATKSLITFLALIPALSLVFLLAELLQQTQAIAPGLAAFGFLLLLTAAVLLSAYKFTFRLGGFLSTYQSLLRKGRDADHGPLEAVTGYARANDQAHLKAGKFGVLCLAASSLLISGALAVAGDPSSWTSIGSVFDLLLSGSFWVRVLQFLAIALGATGVGILFFVFSWQGGRAGLDDEVRALARRIGLRFASWSLLAQPLTVVASVAVLPAAALSGAVYALSGLSLTLFFVAGHFVYAYKRDARSGYAAYAFYTLALALIVLVTRDQLAIRDATREHSVRLAGIAEKEVEDLKTRLGVVLVKALTGQEIYDAKCSACHLFDAKKIGPAYKDVIPKYAGKKAQLIAFVMNPVKVDPAFPSMPNQGLRPSEADSIVTFLMAKFAPAPPSVQSVSR